MSIIEAPAETLGKILQAKDGERVVVTKSTVIPTTTETLAPVVADASNKARGEDLHVAMNPEFLREGAPVIVDGRRAIDRRDGIVYEGLTW